MVQPKNADNLKTVYFPPLQFFKNVPIYESFIFKMYHATNSS